MSRQVDAMDAEVCQDANVLLLGTGIGVKIVLTIELQRVYENAGNDLVAVAEGAMHQ